MRNINSIQHYSPDVVTTVLTEKLPAITDNQLCGAVQTLNKELKALKSQLNNLTNAQQHDDSLLSKMAVKIANTYYMWSGSIYFDFNKTTLDRDAETTIRRIALEMQQQPPLLIKIVGTADYTGHSEYNHHLSIQRAEIIKLELVKRYQIQSERIDISGMGSISEPKTATRQNRRCDFYFSK